MSSIRSKAAAPVHAPVAHAQAKASNPAGECYPGQAIVYFPGGMNEAYPGTVAGVTDGGTRVNIAFVDSNGLPQSRNGVSVAKKVNSGGSYAITCDDGDFAALVKAHNHAAVVGGQGKPATDERAKHPRAPAGEFTSAALDDKNVQKAGSGGPFDPANTSLAHMSEHQREESNSPGNPTTGGMTAKITAESMAAMPATMREHAMETLKNAKMELPELPEPVAPPAPVVQVHDEEAARLERDEKRHKEAVEKSAKIKADRSHAAHAKAAKPAAKKAAARKAPAKAAKKVPAKKAVKKAPAKKVAAKKSRR